MKVFGIDPGSERTGYGCLETDGSRHRLIVCGAVAAGPHASFPEKLLAIHQTLRRLLADHRPDCVAVENVFYAKNVRSALKLGHARGIALLAAVEGGYPLFEYSPAEVKRAVVGYGRAEKPQVGEMVRLLLGLEEAPTPHDAADALAVAICHVHSSFGEAHEVMAAAARGTRSLPKSWRIPPMIASLRGRLADKQPTRLVVDVGGVGYEVLVPLSTFYRLGDAGSDVSVLIHTHVREDTIALYGFGTAFEQQVFERLIAISGIGPKLALSVLSGIDTADFVRAVQNGDIVRLTAIPGVGKKTAERISLELKDRLPLAPATPGAEGSAPADDLRRDLLSALLNLGYHRPLAEKAVDGALKRAESSTFEAVLKQALRELAR